MNLSEMEVMLRKRVNSPAETDQAKAVMYECLNLGYRDICDKFNFREVRGRLRFEGTSAANIYALPATWYEIIRVRYADSNDRGGRLEKAGPNQTFDLDSGAVAGRPTHYALWGNEIQFYPPLDGTYAFEVFAKFEPPKLTSPGDIPLIPPSWHYGIVLLGRYYYWDGAGVTNLAMAQAAMGSFNLWASGRMPPTLRELDDSEQAVEVPTLGRWSDNRHGHLSPEQWRTGGM